MNVPVRVVKIICTKDNRFLTPGDVTKMNVFSHLYEGGGAEILRFLTPGDVTKMNVVSHLYEGELKFCTFVSEIQLFK